MLRRIGAIGDIHEEHDTLERVLTFLRSSDVERILAVGDIADGPGKLARCCQLVIDHGVEAVRGNHDRWALKDELRNLPDATTALSAFERDFLGALPVTREYETAAGPLLLCHGLGEDDMNRLTPDDYGYAIESNDALQELLAIEQYRFVVNGHTHKRMVRHFDGVTIINVGTLFRDHAPCFSVIDFDECCVEFFDVEPGRDIGESERIDLRL